MPIDMRDSLEAWWSKRENDVMIDFPRSCDGHWLAGLFSREFFQELERRGYDKTTLRFSVKRNDVPSNGSSE